MGAALEIGVSIEASIKITVTYEGSWGLAVLQSDQTESSPYPLTCSAPLKEEK